MRKSIVLFVLLFISSLTLPIGSCEEQYNHIWTAESPIIRSNSWFGYQLAIDGEYIITCEPYANVDGFKGAGKIYVYDFEGNLVNTLQSPEPGSVDNFGYRFDAHDGILAVQEVADIDGKKWVGKVHVFTPDGTLQYTLQPQEVIQGATFGMSVSIGEEIILISDRGVDLPTVSVGRVNLYNYEGDHITTLYSPDPKPIGYFGLSTEIGENQFYLAQYGSLKESAPTGPGYVYVYDHQGVLLNTLEAPEPEDKAMFGSTISVSGDKLVIGETRATVDGLYRAGKVHIYNTEGTYLRTLLSPNPDTNAAFGSDVVISGDIIVVGEELGDVNPTMNEGKAYVFNIDGTLLQTLTAPEPAPRGAFGLAVDIQDDIIVVGDCWATVEEHGDCGRLHVYKLGAPVEVTESVVETPTETEDEPETNGGIPGYPLWSIGVAILLISLFLTNKKVKKQVDPLFFTPT
jgi:hypothetical protein